MEEQKNIVPVIVYNSAAVRRDTGWPPENFEKFIAWMQELMETIPSEFKGLVQISIDADEERGFPNSEIVVSYSRPETDAEVAARVADEAEKQRAAEAAERRRYEELKEKFD